MSELFRITKCVISVLKARYFCWWIRPNEESLRWPNLFKYVKLQEKMLLFHMLIDYSIHIISKRKISLAHSFFDINIYFRGHKMMHLHYLERLSSFWYHCLFSIWIMRLRCVQVLFFAFLLRSRLILVNDKIEEILTARNLQSGDANQW